MKYNLEHIQQYITDHLKYINGGFAVFGTILLGVLTYQSIDAALNEHFKEALFIGSFDIATIVLTILSFRDFYRG